MANYEDENHQFSTILSIDDSGVWLENDLWGRFFTKRFDGSIYWDGWRTTHKPGDVIPVLRQKRGNTCAYMTGFDLCKAEQKLRDFINQEEQDAVVTSVVHRHDTNPQRTEIRAYSPVWKEIYYASYGIGQIEVQRGDILTFSREPNKKGLYEYHLCQNKTAKEVTKDGINKILKNFTEAERGRILLLGDRIRLGLDK
jgi:hypothetical protein